MVLLSVAALVVLLASLSGCSEGEDIPLVAPGGGGDWPADPRWHSLNPGLADHLFYDGAWDEAATAAEPKVALVDNRGGVVEYEDGQWTARTTGLTSGLRSVVSVGANAFVAVGNEGGACYGSGGTWRTEDTGTQEKLNMVVAVAGVAWAVGDRGTVRRREAGVWSGLPSAGDAELVGVTVVHDSLFVVERSGGIRVWDGVAWGDLPSGPWAWAAVQGVATVGDGRLYAAADSLYVRTAAGWHTITDSDLHGPSIIGMKVTDRTFWYEYWGVWRQIDPTVAAWQPEAFVPSASRVLAPWDSDNYLIVNWGPTLTWVSAEGTIRDPAGLLGATDEIGLASGGMLVLTDLGVFRCGTAAATPVLDAAQIPLIYASGYDAGYGRDANDFYLVGQDFLYHCVNGQAALVGTWVEDRDIDSIAVGADNVLYMADREGLWRWLGVSWQQVLPLLVETPESFEVWSLGNGSLGARDQSDQYFRQFEGQWHSLGYLRHDTYLLAGADGSLFAIGRMYNEFFASGNVLQIYDEKAGAFRNLGDSGMGPLADLSLRGASSREGEVLIWTHDPTMVFTLKGAPTLADWEVVAGPLAEDFRHLERLLDGNLLALDQASRTFHLYRP